MECREIIPHKRCRKQNSKRSPPNRWNTISPETNPISTPLLSSSTTLSRICSLRLHPRCQFRRRLIQHLLLLRHARQPVQEQRRHDVEPDEGPQDGKVPPAVRVMRTQRRQHDVGVIRGAKLAVVGSVGGVFGQVAAQGVDVGTHVLSTGFPSRGAEGGQFDRRTDHPVIGEACCEHTFDDVGKGGDIIHEYPEAWEGIGTSQDTS